MNVQRLRGKYNDALPLYNRALQIKQALSREEDAQLAQIMNSTAVLYRLRGEYDKAEPLYLRALAIRQRIFGEIHEDVAQSYNSLGCLLQDMGRYKEAEENFLKSISQREFLLGVNHPDVAMSLKYVSYHRQFNRVPNIRSILATWLVFTWIGASTTKQVQSTNVPCPSIKWSLVKITRTTRRRLTVSVEIIACRYLI